MLSFTNCTYWVRHYNKSATKIRQNNLPENFYHSRPQSVAFILTSEDSIYTKSLRRVALATVSQRSHAEDSTIYSPDRYATIIDFYTNP